MEKLKIPFSLVIHAVIVLSMFLICSCESRYQDLDLSAYQYRDTRELVKLVYDASQILKEQGIQGIDYFRSHYDEFRTAEYYLYIYQMDGINLYHAGMPHLEGQNIYDITDRNGKKIFPLVLQALEDKNNPHAWIHYSWWEPGKFYPVPKSSCHFKVTMPDGKEIFVGGGLDYPQEEQEFIRIIVDGAADLIKNSGITAFSEIENPVSQYNFREIKVFAFRPDGEILISPVLNDRLLQIELLECVDEVGHKPFEKAIQSLARSDCTWEVFMARNRYQRILTKKCLYLRKTLLGEEEIYVGAITDLPQPPWAG